MIYTIHTLPAAYVPHFSNKFPQYCADQAIVHTINFDEEKTP